MSFKGEIIISCPPPFPLAKAKLFLPPPPPDLVIYNFYYLPPPPHLVEDLDRVMAKYKATYQIGTKSTTSEARKRKEQRKKKGKEEARNW